MSEAEPARCRHDWKRDAKQPWIFNCSLCQGMAILTETGIREQRGRKRK